MIMLVQLTNLVTEQPFKGEPNFASQWVQQ